MNIYENIATYFGFWEPSSGFNLKDWVYNLQRLKLARCKIFFVYSLRKTDNLNIKN